MQSSFQQSPQFKRNSNQISLSPKNQPSQNIKMMSTKYCLNKPKLFKEFKKSSLFQHSKTTFNLHQYSQRYTYNQRMNSFEKQNHDSSMRIFDGNKSMNVEFVKQKVVKMSKQQIMKRKMPKTADQHHQKRSRFEISIKRTQSDQVLNNSYNTTKALSLKVDKNKQREQKRFKVCNRKFLQQFPNKNEKQVLMSYIKRNPLQFSPIKLNQIKQNGHKMDSLRKLNMSTRRLGQRTNAGSKWNLSTKKLKTTNKLSEEDQKYERQKMKLREQIFVFIDDQIKKMFDLISQLKSLGYVEEKISQWIWTYCENNKKFLQQIIFKPRDYRSSLTDSKVVHKLQDIDEAKANARNFKRVINNVSIDLQIEDLSQLTNYLEQIFISRQYFELKRIQNQIQDTKNLIKDNYSNMKDEKAGQILKMVNTFDENKKFKPLEYYEMLSFYQDAKRIESHLGKVKGLTPGNKRKFEDLTDVELQLNRKSKEVQE